MPATDAAATRMLNKKLSQIFRMRGLTVKLRAKFSWAKFS